MKKRLTLIVLVALFALTAAVFAACTPSDTDSAAQGYAAIKNANRIEQNITVKNGNFVQSSIQKVYTKNGNNFDWTQTEKTLNKLDFTNTEEYTTSNTSGTVGLNGNFAPNLNLKTEYLVEGYTSTDELFEANIVAGHEKDVLGITQTLPAPTDNMKLKIDYVDGRATLLEISYTSGAFAVAISVSFTY